MVHEDVKPRKVDDASATLGAPSVHKAIPKASTVQATKVTAPAYSDKASMAEVPKSNVAPATPSVPSKYHQILQSSTSEVPKVTVAPASPSVPSKYNQILQSSTPEAPKVSVAPATPSARSKYEQDIESLAPEAPKINIAPSTSDNSPTAKPSLNVATTEQTFPSEPTSPSKVVAAKPNSKKVMTALPQESKSFDARPEVKPDLSKAPSLNSYLFGDSDVGSDGGGDSELSSLISKVHEMEQAPVRPVASMAAMPVAAASPSQVPEWAKPMPGDPTPSRTSASLMEEPNAYAGDSSSYTSDPNVLKTLRLGRFGDNAEIKSNAEALANQEWAATEMSDKGSALTGFLEGATGGVRAKPTPVVPHVKKSKKVILKEDISALDKIMGKLR